MQQKTSLDSLVSRNWALKIKYLCVWWRRWQVFWHLSFTFFPQGAKLNRTGPSHGPPLNLAKKTPRCASQSPVSGFVSSSPKAPKSSPNTTSTCATVPRPCPRHCTLIDLLLKTQARDSSHPWIRAIAHCPHHLAKGILDTRLLGLLWWSTPWRRRALPPCDEETRWRPPERHLHQAASSSTCCLASPRCTAANPTSFSWGTAWKKRRRQSKWCVTLRLPYKLECVFCWQQYNNS